MADLNPSYVDTLSNLFNTNRINSKAPSNLGFPNIGIVREILKSTTVMPYKAEPGENSSFPVTGNFSTPNPTYEFSTKPEAVSTISDFITSTISATLPEIVSGSDDGNISTASFIPTSMVNVQQRTILVTFLFFLIIIGILGNSLALHVILNHPTLQMRCHYWNMTTFNLTLADVVGSVLHCVTLLVYGSNIMMVEDMTEAAREHRTQVEMGFFCKFQFVVSFVCFVVPIWVLVIGLVERLLAQGWSAEYNDLLNYKKLSIFFIGSWFIGFMAAMYTIIPEDWVTYNPTTTYCNLSLQNPVGFPWFMLCFFYFVVLPIVCIIPLIIFILSDVDSVQQLPTSHPGQPIPLPSHFPPPRIQISEILQWNSRRSSCLEPAEVAQVPADEGVGFWARCLARLKALNCCKTSESTRTPVETVAPPTRLPGTQSSRSRLQAGEAGRNRVAVDMYGGGLFTLTQQRSRPLRDAPPVETTLIDHQILHSLLIVLATFVLFKSPSGLLAICKMFAMEKNSMSVSSNYAYAEIVTLCMYVVGCCINPFVYIFARLDFKYAYAKVWKSCMDVYF